MADQYLVLMDTDKIKDYVFATGRLKEIRGASALLDHLNKGVVPDKAKEYGGNLIFAAGGAAMIIFEDKGNAIEFSQLVEKHYLDVTHAASVTSAVINFTTGEPFFEVAKRAAYQLRRKKIKGRLPLGILPEPLFSRCHRCGSYAVEYSFNYPEKTFICRVCEKKQAVTRGSTGTYSGMNILAEQRLAERARERFDWGDVQFPEILEDFHNLSSPSNYLGMVYADGNGVGNIIQNQIKTIIEMKGFSDILDNAIYDSIIESLNSIGAVKNGVIPLIPILIGGDDLIVLIASQYAFDFANVLCNNFNHIVKESSQNLIKEHPEINYFGGQPLDVSMSAGVVLAKINHPIRALEQLASELLISAKHLSKNCKSKYGNQGTFDYQIVKTATTNNLSIIREEEYQLDATRYATARPYLCQRVENLDLPAWPDLKESIQLLKKSGFPKNKLHEWQSLIYLPPEQAVMEINFWMNRLSDEHKNVMKKISAKLNLGDPKEMFFTDPLQRPQKRSPYPDLEEIYEFIQE